MKQHARNVLVVGVDPDEFGRVAPFLARDDFDVDRFPGPEGALELLSEISFEVLIVRYPLPDMPLEGFLEAVRAETSPCRSAPLVLLAAGEPAEAERYIGQGANRIVALEDSENDVQRTVSALLSVAPRKAARFLARVEVKLGGAKDLITCQTVNISETGMLIETDRRFEKGTRIHVSFHLEDDERPIVGVAEVVRLTNEERDPVQGIGLRFLSFAGDSQRRFQAYLRRL